MCDESFINLKGMLNKNKKRNTAKSRFS
jgi:hypothetical protein